MLTVKSAAEQVGVSQAMVYGWCQSGSLSHIRLGSKGCKGRIRIEEADLQAFLASQKCEGRPEATPRQYLKKKTLKLSNLRLPS